jgi:hypothetical protein
MRSILRIFKYCRNRIIKLSIENKQLKLQIEYLRATLNKDEYTKH